MSPLFPRRRLDGEEEGAVPGQRREVGVDAGAGQGGRVTVTSPMDPAAFTTMSRPAMGFGLMFVLNAAPQAAVRWTSPIDTFPIKPPAEMIRGLALTVEFNPAWMLNSPRLTLSRSRAAWMRKSPIEQYAPSSSITS